MLAGELEAAEEAFRTRLAEITEQLPEVAKAAEKTPADSPLAKAAARITPVARFELAGRLGPYWMLIMLYWLIVHLNVDSMAALTLWYMVASDTFKRRQGG